MAMQVFGALQEIEVKSQFTAVQAGLGNIVHALPFQCSARNRASVVTGSL
jgi:hypothetical protein